MVCVTSGLKDGRRYDCTLFYVYISPLNMHKSHISCSPHSHHYLCHSLHLNLKQLQRLHTDSNHCVRVWFLALCRWLMVEDSFVLYMRPKDNQVGMVILYDKGFHIKMSAQETAVHHGVTIETLCRQASVLIIFTFCCDGTASQCWLCWLHPYKDYLWGVFHISVCMPQMSEPYCLGTKHAVSIRLYKQRCEGL